MDFSFSNSLSKGSVYESDSIFGAYQHDAESRLADGIRPEAISNEQIHRGDVILETYNVEDDAIHGGMGSVWRVHHNSWNTDLAMKRPQPRFFAEGSNQRKADFVAECEHWINLGLHPNIVSCYYVRDIGSVPTIFSEWMDGGSLKDAIQSGRLYEGAEDEVQARILDIAIQTARGLMYSHEQGLIHQDVKPGNILLTKDWEAKVADFGLAKAQSQLTDGERPVSSGYTLAYCPKAQAEGASAEKWMDVYAWALTVLEMFLGDRPWQMGAEAPARFEEIIGTARVPISEPVAALLKRCLTEQPGDLRAMGWGLEKAWLARTGIPYPRAEPAAAADTTDSLNNRALSFLDLGMADTARGLLDAALKKDPDAALARFNHDLMRMHGDWETQKGDDAYRVMDDVRRLEGMLAESCLGRPTALKHALQGELSVATYMGLSAEMEFEQAAFLSGEGTWEREQWAERSRQAKRAWFPLPFRPVEMLYGGFCYNTRGDTLALAWPEEVNMDDDLVECVSIALYDLAERREIIRRRLKGRVPFNRVFLEPDRVLLWWDEDRCAAFDIRTLDPLGEVSGEAWMEPEDAEEWWPRLTLRDGLRRINDITEGREEAQFTNRHSTFMTIGFGRKPSAKRSGLEAKLPAAGLFEDDHALEVDSDRRWILVYRRPYTDQENDSFFICDTDFYGRMPEYVIARAVSTMEQLSVQQKRRAALDKASKALAHRSPECFDAMMEAYALFPDNPDEEWMALNDRASAFGVRKALLGTHKGAALDERALEARDEARGYPGDDPGYELFAACKLEISREGDGWIGELDGEAVACWPVDAIREDVAALAHYDRARRVAYLCCDGVFSAWDCAKKPATRLGEVRYGVRLPEGRPGDWHPTRDFEPFRPGETEGLWAVEPTCLMLNRAENATVAILRGRVLNVYGADRISEAFTGVDGFAAVQAIDLTTMTRLRQIFYSESSDLIELEAERLTFAECNLAGVSADGAVMAWNRYTIGAELWAFPEPGVILAHSVSGFEIDQVRRDGNAVLTKLIITSAGDTVQEILLEWQYGAPGEGEAAGVPATPVETPSTDAVDSASSASPSASTSVTEESGPAAPAREPGLHRGDVVAGEYEVLDDRIYGGMSYVWHVRYVNSGEELAMEQPSGSNERILTQFRRTFEIWKGLGAHPGIVRCRETKDLNGVPTAFCEWMAGGSLRERIRDGSLYAGDHSAVQRRILSVAAQTARALHRVHLLGILHGDVKPANILFTSGGEAKVGDFGLARRMDEQDGKVFGFTLEYCPQEMMDGKPVQRWMDVYAWALTVLEMYLRQRPWGTGAEGASRFVEYAQGASEPMPEGMFELLKGCLIRKAGGFEQVMTALDDIMRRYTDEAGTNGTGAPDPGVYRAEQQELERLEKALAGADDRVESARTAYERADVRYNNPEREQMSRRIDDLRNQISRLGIFGFGKKKKLHAEQVLLERKVADLFIERREAKERLEAAQKAAEDARRALEEFRRRLFGGE